MKLPEERGPISSAVIAALRGEKMTRDQGVCDVVQRPPEQVVTDDDMQLALWVLYELHYRGFDDLSGDPEWDPALIGLRAQLEAPFEQALRGLTLDLVRQARHVGDDVVSQLHWLSEAEDGPSLARYIQRSASREQFEEFLVHRSVYHLKESDPHSFVIARLVGGAKTALVELQYDEYGAGRPERLHASLFARCMAGAGLDSEYGAYVHAVPALTLAVSNAMSLFCLHRRLRGAAMGHLAAFEMTSSIPSRRIASGIRRLDLGDEAAEYFDEHVEADAVHEQVAARDVCGRLVASDPGLQVDVLVGAAACVRLDALSATALVGAWEDGRSSLRPAVAGAVA